jgi:transcriptional regulator with XRE-family HTH domain
MKDRSKKYLQKSTDDALHIGNLIAWVIQEKHLKKKDVSQYLNVLPTTLNQYFKQPSVQVAILWRLSKALNYNLLMDVGERLQIPFETKVEKELKEDLATKNGELEHLKIELNLLKRIHKIE